MDGMHRLYGMLCIVMLCTACGKNHEIVGHLSEYEANEVMVLLASNHIEAQKVVQEGRTISYAIAVKEADAKKALKILVTNKLPREKSNGFAEVYPLGSSGLIPTKSEEKARYMMALQGEVENLLKVLPGVMQARVLLVLPDTEALRNAGTPAPKATASVTIVYNPNLVKPGTIPYSEQIKQLVASAVEDLQPSAVTVVMAQHRMLGALPSTQKRVLAKPKEKPAKPVVVEQAKAIQKKQSSAMDFFYILKRSYLDLGMIALGFLGLLFGVLSVLRAFQMKSKLVRLQKEQAQSSPPTE